MKLFYSIILLSIFLSCNSDKCAKKRKQDIIKAVDPISVERIDTLDCIILYPNYSSIDLVCGEMPSKNDSSVIFVAEAAYTGDTLKEFKHSNIAGNHVSGGKLYNGYPCKENTGAFIYFDKKWEFCYKNYSSKLNMAEANDGMAFGQEMIIYKGNLVKTARKDYNNNQFRALCNHKGRLCVIESSKKINFGDFKRNLIDLGITDAIYLDMGPGWNHAWYRRQNNVVELHPKTHSYCTNWITFYK